MSFDQLDTPGDPSPFPFPPVARLLRCAHAEGEHLHRLLVKQPAEAALLDAPLHLEVRIHQRVQVRVREQRAAHRGAALAREGGRQLQGPEEKAHHLGRHLLQPVQLGQLLEHERRRPEEEELDVVHHRLTAQLVTRLVQPSRDVVVFALLGIVGGFPPGRQPS